MKKIKSTLEEILQFTVQLYIEEGLPVSSTHLQIKYDIKYSSAKIRYLMNELEKEGFLEKAHVSAGRIPSVNGLKYYSKYLSESKQEQITKQLKQIFSKRKTKITETVDQAATLISELTGFTLITSEDDSSELLKSIQFVPLDDSSATVVLVVSSGKVYSKILKFDNKIFVLNDLKVAIRLFKERLIDVKMSELSIRAMSLKNILAKAIANHEELLEEFVTHVFNFELKRMNKIYGKNNIILSENINRVDLNKMLQLIENHSIWEVIDAEVDDDEPLKISISKSGAYISKKLKFESNIKEISVVGTTKSDFAKMRSAIFVLEDLLSKKHEKEIKNESKK